MQRDAAAELEHRLWVGILALVRDVRHAIRSLMAAPAFVAVTLLSIALGIGASTSLFSIVNALLLRALPVASPEQLVRMTTAGAACASLGFARDVMVATVTPTTVPAEQRNRLYHELVAALRDVPGVAHVGGSLNPPLVGMMGGGFVVSPPGTPPPPDAERIRQFTEVTPEWFAAYGTALRAGRDFVDGDRVGSEPVMIVNEAFVRQVLRMDTPVHAVDTMLAVTSRFPPLGDMPLGAKRIVGVVEDAVYRNVRDARRPTIYLPLGQRSGPLMYDSFFITVLPRVGSPMALTQEVGAALVRVDPDLTVRYRRVGDQVSDLLAQDRVLALIAGFFGGVAVLLAALGLYGVTAYTVSRRRPEIALRLALGATPVGIALQVLSRLAGTVGLGIAVGLVISLWASTLIASQLFGIDSHDAATFLGAVAVLTGVCAVAGWLPARRASKLDPATILRET